MCVRERERERERERDTERESALSSSAGVLLSSPLCHKATVVPGNTRGASETSSIRIKVS